MLFFMRLCVTKCVSFHSRPSFILWVFFVFQQLLPSTDYAVLSVLSDAIVLVFVISFGAIVVCNCSQHLFIDSTYRVFVLRTRKTKIGPGWRQLKSLEVNDNHIYQRKFGLGNFQSKCIHKTHVDNENEEEGTHPHTFKKKAPPKMYDMNASNVYLTRTYY